MQGVPLAYEPDRHSRICEPMLCPIILLLSRIGSAWRDSRVEMASRRLEHVTTEHPGADVSGELPNCVPPRPRSFRRVGSQKCAGRHRTEQGVIEPKSDFCLRLGVLKAVRYLEVVRL